MFTLRDDANLLKDFGVSNLLLSGLLLAAFGAAAAGGREAGSGGAQAIIVRPVGRATFVLGRLAGVLAALAAATALFALALLLAARQGPPRGEHEPLDWPAAAGSWGALGLSLAAAALAGLFRARRAGGVLLKAGLGAYAASVLLVALFDARGRFAPFAAGYDPLLARAMLLAFFAILLLGTAAVVLSCLWRRGAVLATLLLFVAGLAAGGAAPSWLVLVPDLQLFWAGDLFYRRDPSLPLGYVACAGAYALAAGAVWVGFGLWFYRRKELS
jgi:hypothetical protein